MRTTSRIPARPVSHPSEDDSSRQMRMVGRAIDCGHDCSHDGELEPREPLGVSGGSAQDTGRNEHA